MLTFCSQFDYEVMTNQELDRSVNSQTIILVQYNKWA